MLFEILASMNFSVHTILLQLIGVLSIVVSCLFVSGEILDGYRVDAEVVAPEALTDSQQPLSGFWGEFGILLFGDSVEPQLVPESSAPKLFTKSQYLQGKEHDGLFEFEPQWFTQIKENLQDIRAHKKTKHPRLQYVTG